MNNLNLIYKSSRHTERNIFLTAIAEGRELQTVSNTRRMMNDGGPLASQSRSPGRESIQRLCTCLKSNKVLTLLNWFF